MPFSIPEVATNSSPAATTYFDGKSVFVAWKGDSSDAIYWTKTTTLTPNSVGEYSFNPSPQTKLNFVSSNAPAVASYNGRVYLAWKGEEGDDAIYWSSFDGNTWQPKTKLAALTPTAPALVATANAIFLVWKGASDNSIWWAVLGDEFDGPNNFTILGPIKVGETAFATAATPSLTADGNTVYMAWTGASDGVIYWASCRENPQSTVTYPSGTLPQAGGINAWGNYLWANQQSIESYQANAVEADDAQTAPSFTSGAGPTYSGPALTFAQGQLYLAWVQPAFGSANSQFGAEPPSINVAYSAGQAGNWLGAINSGVTDSTDAQPAIIGVFSGSNSVGKSPIYFFKGFGSDSKIYYDSQLVESGSGLIEPNPIKIVLGGKGTPGFPP